MVVEIYLALPLPLRPGVNSLHRLYYLVLRLVILTDRTREPLERAIATEVRRHFVHFADISLDIFRTLFTKTLLVVFDASTVTGLSRGIARAAPLSNSRKHGLTQRRTRISWMYATIFRTGAHPPTILIRPVTIITRVRRRRHVLGRVGTHIYRA